MSKEVYTIRDYGKINVQLREYMEAKKITRNALAKATNTRFEVIDRWYNGTVERIDADVLARICYVLEVHPGDLIQYEKIE